MKKLACQLAILQAFAVWMALLSASAVIRSQSGNEPVTDAGWPAGALELANLQSRLGWLEGPPFGGGRWTFCYRGDSVAFNQALVAFAAIRAPALDLVVEDGPGTNSILGTQVHWDFTVWVPANWNHLYNNPQSFFMAANGNFHKPVAPPCLTVYVGGGQVDWAKVTIPPSIHVRDERAAAAGVDLSGGSVLQTEFFDMDTGKPVKGAHLLVDQMTWTTNPSPQWNSERIAEKASDASGRVRIEGIAAGNHQGWVRVTAVTPKEISASEDPRAAQSRPAVEAGSSDANGKGFVVNTSDTPLSLFEWLGGVHTGVIIGMPAVGKSAAMHFLTLDLLSDSPKTRALADKWNGYLPFFCPFSLLTRLVGSKRVPSIPIFFEKWLRLLRVPINVTGFLRDALVRNRILMIVDGLDEGTDDGAADTAKAMVLDFAGSRGFPIIATTRPHRYERLASLGPNWTCAELMPFGEAQRRQFVETWVEHVRRFRPKPAESLSVREESMAVMSEIEQKVAVQELAGNPLLLSILIGMRWPKVSSQM